MTTIEQLLISGSNELATFSETARLDCEVILQFVLNCSSLALIKNRTDPVTDSERTSFENLIARRRLGEPVAYLVGRKEFWNREFLVNPSVLIPRPETELIIDEVLKILPTLKTPIATLDLGTGSGILAVTIAKELENLHANYSISAVDLSQEALRVAKENARIHSASNIDFIQSNWFDYFAGTKTKFNLIVANPPYIANNDARVSASTKFEPSTALYSGNSGLKDYETILSALPEYLAQGGYFISEFGFDQRSQIENIILSAGSFVSQISYSFKKDLAGLDRILVIQNERR